jgi:hypothetical protein
LIPQNLGVTMEGVDSHISDIKKVKWVSKQLYFFTGYVKPDDYKKLLNTY